MPSIAGTVNLLAVVHGFHLTDDTAKCYIKDSLATRKLMRDTKTNIKSTGELSYTSNTSQKLDHLGRFFWTSCVSLDWCLQMHMLKIRSNWLKINMTSLLSQMHAPICRFRIAAVQKHAS